MYSLRSRLSPPALLSYLVNLLPLRMMDIGRVMIQFWNTCMLLSVYPPATVSFVLAGGSAKLKSRFIPLPLLVQYNFGNQIIDFPRKGVKLLGIVGY
jgi:hypothetical protein